MTQQHPDAEAMSFDEIAGGYGRRFSGLLAELVQSEAQMTRLREQNERLRAENVELQRRVDQSREQAPRPDPGALAAQPVVEHAPPV